MNFNQYPQGAGGGLGAPSSSFMQNQAQIQQQQQQMMNNNVQRQPGGFPSAGGMMGQQMTGSMNQNMYGNQSVGFNSGAAMGGMNAMGEIGTPSLGSNALPGWGAQGSPSPAYMGGAPNSSGFGGPAGGGLGDFSGSQAQMGSSLGVPFGGGPGSSLGGTPALSARPSLAAPVSQLSSVGGGFGSSYSNLQQPSSMSNQPSFNAGQGRISSVSPAMAPATPKSLASLVTLDFITPQDLASFESTFNSAGPSANGQLAANETRNVFIKSGLNDQVLAHVWNLCSVCNNSGLSFPEFAVGMYLIRLQMSGSQIPQSLPDNVRSQILSSAAAITAAFGPRRESGSRPSTMQLNQGSMAPQSMNMTPLLPQQTGMMSTAPLIPQQTGIMSGSPAASPAASRAESFTDLVGGGRRMTDGFLGSLGSKASATMSPKPERASTSGANWAILPAEKAQYDAVFKVWDSTNSGFIAGDRAKNVFQQSGLPDNILAHIWTLADIQKRGKLNSNEFAVAMHLVYKKLNGQDLPQVLPPELIPPATRELDAMASMMRNQVMSSIMTKKPMQSASSLTNLSNDPLFAGLPKSSSKTTLAGHDTNEAIKAVQEEERRSIADKVESKKRQLNSILTQYEASKSAHDELEKTLTRARRDAANAHEDIIYNINSKNSLVEQISAKGGTTRSPASIEAKAQSVEREILDLIAENRRLEREFADKKIQKIKAKSGPTGGDVTNKAAALLAARMAALGVNAPTLGGGGSSDSSADISRVEEELGQHDAELDAAADRVRDLMAEVQQFVTLAGPSVGVGKSTDSSIILATLKGWEPSIDDKMKYEEGIGLRNKEVRELVDDLKKKTPTLLAPSGGHAARVDVALSSTPSLSDNPYTSASLTAFTTGPPKEPSAISPTNPNFNPLAPFASVQPTSPTKTAPPTMPKPAFSSSAPTPSSSYPQKSPMSPSRANLPHPPPISTAHQAAPEVPAVPTPASSAITNKVNDVLAQAEAAIRAAKERAAARATTVPSLSAASLYSSPVQKAAPAPKSPAVSQPPAVLQPANNPFGSIPKPAVPAESPAVSSTTSTVPMPASVGNPFAALNPQSAPLDVTSSPMSPFSSSGPAAASSATNPFGVANPPASKQEDDLEKALRRFKEQEAEFNTAKAVAAVAPVAPPAGMKSVVDQIRHKETEVTEKKKPPPPPPPSRNKVAPPVPPPSRTHQTVDLSSERSDLAKAAQAAREATARLNLGGNTTLTAPPPPPSRREAVEVPGREGGSVREQAKTFNPFGPRPVTTEESAAPPVEASVLVSPPTGGAPPPPPPPLPPLLGSISATASPQPSAAELPSIPNDGPPPPPPPPPLSSIEPRDSIAQANASGTPKSTNSSPPRPGGDPLLKSALASLRGRLARDDSDSDDEDWGPGSQDDDYSPMASDPKLSSTSAPPPPPAPPVQRGSASVPDAFAPVQPQVTMPAADSFTSSAPPPPPPASSFAPPPTFDAGPPMPPLGGAPPPPPPPLPPPGIVAPVKNFSRNGSSSNVDEAPKKKPSPADVGAVGPNIFAMAAAAAAAKLKPVSAPTSEPPKASTPFDAITSPASAKEPPAVSPSPPNQTMGNTPFFEKPSGASSDGWEIVTKEDDWSSPKSSDLMSGATSVAEPQQVSLLDDAFIPGSYTMPLSTGSSAAPVPRPSLGQTESHNRLSGWSDVFSDEKAAPAGTETTFEPAPTVPTVAEVPEPEPEEPIVLYTMKCLYHFEKGRADDMDMKANDIINVEKEDGEWLYGLNQSSGTKGWFPKNFAELYDPSKPPPPIDKPIGRAEAVYDYTAVRDDELTILPGERLVILEKMGDWWKVENNSKASGLVPAIYLKELGEEEEKPSPTGPAVRFRENYNVTIMQRSSSMPSRSSYHEGFNEDMLFAMPMPDMSRSSSQRLNVPPADGGYQHWVSVVDPARLEQLSVEERKRQEAIFELIQTEQHYVRDLQLIVEVFYQPMSQFMSAADLNMIFSNIEDLLMTNIIILSDFEAAQAEQNYVVNNIGQLFMRHAKSLDVYKTYCGNQLAASKLLQKKRQESERLQEFLKNCQRNPKCRALDLSSFLLQPMQRITRYTLILKQVLHYTPMNHPEYEAMLGAVEAADVAAEKVNNAAKEQEGREKLESMASLIDFESNTEFERFNLLGPSRLGRPRLYLFDSPLVKAKSGRKLHGYMLNDVILIVQPQKSMFNDRGYMYQLYHAPLPINEVSVRDVPRSSKEASTADETTFQIVHRDEVITVKAPSATVKNKWLQHHEAAIRSMYGRASLPVTINHRSISACPSSPFSLKPLVTGPKLSAELLLVCVDIPSLPIPTVVAGPVPEREEMFSWINLSVTIIAGIATTLATGAIVSIGLQYLIKDHNHRKTVARFKRKRKGIVTALNTVEQECDVVLGNSLLEVKSLMYKPIDDVAVDSSNTMATAGAPSTNSSIPASSSPDSANVTPTSSRSSSKSSSPKRTNLKKVDSKEPLNESSKTSITLSSTELKPITAAERRQIEKRLRELDEYLIRLLEKIDAIRPAEMAVDGYVGGDSTLSAASTQTKSISSEASAIKSASTLSPSAPQQQTSTDIASASLVSTLWILDVEGIDKSTVKIIDKAIGTCKNRKKAIVRKVQSMIQDVDKLLAVIAQSGEDRLPSSPTGSVN
ncbi:Intersectin 1 (SH3 domain protein) [Chytridiales sp. JEL 0842]|nr:Intersectin 1 (SH3 domain protein) [Chytridiales sp. JEL 0842]